MKKIIFYLTLAILTMVSLTATAQTKGASSAQNQWEEIRRLSNIVENIGRLSGTTNGAYFINNATAVADSGYLVHVIADAIIDSLYSDWLNANYFHNVSLSKGTVLGGNFTRIKLVSGIVAYYKK